MRRALSPANGKAFVPLIATLTLDPGIPEIKQMNEAAGALGWTTTPTVARSAVAVERVAPRARASPACRRPCPRCPPRCRAGRSPLPAGPRPGRVTRHASTPGPLPPRSRHPVPQDRTAGGGEGRTLHRARVVPDHGDDLLA